MALVYSCFGLGQFISPMIIHFLSPKYTLFLSGICYVFYIASNTYMIIGLYFAASAICGFGAALLWSSVGVLLSGYEQTCSTPSLCYSSFYTLYSMYFVGNFVSFIFDPSHKENMFMALTVITSIATILFLFVPNSPPAGQGSVRTIILSTLKSYKIYQLWLLFPVAISFGVSLSFYYTTMPSLMPISMTAYIYICMGVSMIVSSFCWGFVIKKFSEKVILLFPLCASVVSAVLGMLLVLADITGSDRNIIACVLAAFSGISDSGTDFIITALVNRIWPKEVSQLCAWRIVYLLAMCIALLYSAFIEKVIVLSIVLAVCCLGVLSQVVVILLYNRCLRPIETENHDRLNTLLGGSE